MIQANYQALHISASLGTCIWDPMFWETVASLCHAVRSVCRHLVFHIATFVPVVAFLRCPTIASEQVVQPGGMWLAIFGSSWTDNYGPVLYNSCYQAKLLGGPYVQLRHTGVHRVLLHITFHNKCIHAVDVAKCACCKQPSYFQHSDFRNCYSTSYGTVFCYIATERPCQNHQDVCLVPYLAPLPIVHKCFRKALT